MSRSSADAAVSVLESPVPARPTVTTPVADVRPGPSPDRTWPVLVAVAAVASAATLWERGAVAAVPVVAAVGVLGGELSLPRYRRGRSWQPVRAALAQSGSVLLLVAVTGLLALPDLRLGLLSALGVLAVPTAARALAWLRHSVHTTLLVGDRSAVTHLLAQWGRLPDVHVVGVCLAGSRDESAPDAVAGVPVLGGPQQAAVLAAAHHVRQVVVAPGPALSAYDVRRLSWSLEDSPIELAVATEVHGAVPHRVEPRLVGKRLLLSVGPTRRTAVATWVKAAFDRLAAALLLAVLSPLLLVLAAAVRVDSPGPALFVQQRAGRHGRPFPMVKFRTMTAEAERLRAELLEHNEGTGPLFKIRDDPRVTRVGRLLRASSLDELPQLVNVLRGQMSLIGPRPALVEETATYDEWVRRRLALRPGMTGAWQVSGRSGLGWEESVRLDLDYVDNWTLAGDVGIARRTVHAVLRRDGAC